MSFVFSNASIGMLFVDYFTDACLWLNVILHFFIRRPPREGTEPETLSQVRRRYLSSWFAWDILTSLPIDFVMIVIGMYPTVRLPRVLRIFTDSNVLSVRSLQHVIYNVSLVGLVQLSFAFAMLTHFAACIYWSFTYSVGFGTTHSAWLPHYELAHQTVALQYLVSQYQTVVLLTGLGEKPQPKVSEHAA